MFNCNKYKKEKCVSVSRCLDADKLGSNMAEHWSTHCLCTEVGWPWKWKSLSRVRLCHPMDYTVHGVLQARMLEWVAFPFSSGSSRSRNRTGVSCIAGRILYQLSHQGRWPWRQQLLITNTADSSVLYWQMTSLSKLVNNSWLSSGKKVDSNLRNSQVTQWLEFWTFTAVALTQSLVGELRFHKLCSMAKKNPTTPIPSGLFLHGNTLLENSTTLKCKRYLIFT